MTPRVDKLIGQQLGSYKIIEAIGQGGMARVYKGYHKDLDRYAAIKVITWGLDENEEFTARFRREAQAIAALRHPHIVTIFDFGKYERGYYMVMEYIEGQDVGQLLDRKEPILPATIQRIVANVASALDYAHANGVVHRDTKPSNIMLTKNGQAILTDFGLVMLPDSMGNTTIGNAFGTPYYMAPEQAVSSASAVPASDIYSLGIILFELIAGTPPYVADSPLGVALKHVSDPIPDIRDFAPDTPEAVSAVIQKAMAKEPIDRFTTATKMAQALSQAWGSTPVQSSKPVPIIPANVTLPSKKLVLPTALPPQQAQTTSTQPTNQPTKPNKQFQYVWIAITVIVLFILTAGVLFNLNNPALTATSTVTATLAVVNQPTQTATPTSPTPSPEPTATSTELATTEIPTATSQPSPTFTTTPTPVPTDTVTPLPTDTPTPTSTLTPTPTETPTVFIPTNTPNPFNSDDPLQALRGKILFKTDRSGRVEIYVMNEDGSNQIPLPPELAYLYNEAVRWEAFSPDKSETIVVRGEGQLDLWWVKIDGSGELRITTDGAADYDPVWSPVDNRIVFVSERTGRSDIYILTLEGSGVFRLTLNEEDFDKHPSWSPDGTQVVFWSDRGWQKNPQIWKLDIDTEVAISLSNNPFKDWDPVWVK